MRLIGLFGFLLMSVSSVAWAAKELPSFTLDFQGDQRTVVMQDAGQAAKKYKKMLTTQGREIKSIYCHTAIDLPVGLAKGNHSYGAVCGWKEGKVRKGAIVCDDVMMGRFKLKEIDVPVKYPVSINEVAAFVKSNCFGG